MSEDAATGRQALLEALERRLGHRFSDPALLERALTHSSRAHEDLTAATRHNEPFEFLGDAVLGFLVADLLHRRDPEGAEGGKTKSRASLVSARNLAARAAELGLPELLRLGRGEEKTGGRRKTALWADAYEAVVAALYLDGGIEVARRFILLDLGTALAAPGGGEDYKSALQERLQGRGQPLPEYVVVAEQGPAHRRRYVIECRLAGSAAGRGEGTTKKEAQQQAARSALTSLG